MKPHENLDPLVIGGRPYHSRLLIGTGKFLASSNGPVHFVEPPVRVDPQAVVGWADVPSPCHHYDHSYMMGAMGMARAFSGFGGQSGEEHQFDFGGKGTVLMQSSEKVVETPAMVAEIEGQIAMLGVPGLQRVQQRVQQQLAAAQSQGV